MLGNPLSRWSKSVGVGRKSMKNLQKPGNFKIFVFLRDAPRDLQALSEHSVLLDSLL